MLQDSDDIFSHSYIPGTLTNHKYETLGTRDAVKDSRQHYLLNQKKEQGTHRNNVRDRMHGRNKIYFHFYVVFVLPIRVYYKQKIVFVFAYIIITLNCHKFTFLTSHESYTHHWYNRRQIEGREFIFCSTSLISNILENDIQYVETLKNKTFFTKTFFFVNLRVSYCEV